MVKIAKKKVVAFKFEIDFNAIFAHQFLEQINTDVTFVLRDLNGQDNYRILKAHKFVLSGTSALFHALLCDHQEGAIIIEETPYQAFKWLLWILYSKKIVAMPESYENIPFYGRDIYIAAQKFNTKAALSLIRDVIVYRLKSFPAEALVWHIIAKVFSDSIIEETALEAFKTNTSVVLSDQNMLRDCHPETLEVIFSLDEKNINDEMELVTALEYFMKHNKQYTPDHEKIQSIKSHIYFSKLTKDQIRKTKILTPIEMLYILHGNGNMFK